MMMVTAAATTAPAKIAGQDTAEIAPPENAFGVDASVASS